jgi:chorismate lyase / 3-hydroxybenzoate synthase
VKRVGSRDTVVTGWFLRWPRIAPTGVGAPNMKGIDHYSRLVDALLEAGIRPWCTIYHWDLPQALEDRGGWPNRELLEKFGYSSVFRMWNFIGDINRDNAEGLEVYRDFCRGRAEAFEQCRVDFEQFPAATGIGSRGGGVAFYLLACRSGGHRHIENPRQVPAYHYPKRYGPRAPRFARATYLPSRAADGVGGQIFVSGTASVVGHETAHGGNLVKQCQQALENIELVISPGNLAAHGVSASHGLRDMRNIKVYVRKFEDIPTVRGICREAFSADANIAYFTVDICRADLLVEIEGIVM